MEPLKFEEVKQLLNACRLTELKDKPTDGESGRWELYEGQYRVHVITYKFSLLYLYSDVRKEDLVKAKRTAFVPNETMVVYAPSSSIIPSIRSAFEKDAKGFWSTPEYLRSFMANELAEYREKLRDDLPRDYIAPSFTVPSGVVRKYPNPIESFLTDPAYKGERGVEGSLAVVLAEAGHGKTYMCQWLVAKLASEGSTVLPIYVNSAQWKLLRHEDLSSLGRTLVSSFRELGTPIPWIEGQEELFLKVALKAGLFKIVFDGFDEYVLRNPGEIKAKEVYEALYQLAVDTGTRVVVTSRTSFWNSEINTEADESGQDTLGASCYLYNIEPFGTEQARNYFTLKLNKNAGKISAAVSIFSELNQDDPTFAGRGFVLFLISELLAHPGYKSNESKTEKPLLRLIRALCDREIVRHELPISSQQQLDALENYVYEIVQGEHASSDTMSFAIKSVVPELSDEAIESMLIKMAPHALVMRENFLWKIRQPQVQMALLANKLIKMAGDECGRTLLKTFSDKALLDSGEISDLAAMIFSIASWGKSPLDTNNFVRQIIARFFDASQSHLDEMKTQVLKRLSTSLAVRAIESDKNLKNHSDRATTLSTLFPSSKFKDIVFFGGMTRYDFSGLVFENCIFDNVRWANCTFGPSTSFKSCRLFGGSIAYCKGFENIDMQGVQKDEEARRFIESEAIRQGKKKYTEENLKSDIYIALEQFIGKGGVGFKAVETTVYGRGKISGSPHKEKILNEIRTHLLDEHHVTAGSKKAHAIADGAKESVKALMSNNVLTSEVLELYNNLKSKLIE